MGNSDRLEKELNKFLGKWKFNIDKDEDGLFQDEIARVISAGFAVNFRKKQYMINRLTEELEKKGVNVESLLFNDEFSQKHEEVERESLDILLSMMMLDYDLDKPKELYAYTAKRLDLMIRGIENMSESIPVSILEKIEKNKDVAKGLNKIIERYQESRQLDYLKSNRQALFNSSMNDEKENKQIEAKELKRHSISIIKAVGGVLKAKGIINEHNINALEFMENENKYKAIKVKNDVSVLDVYVAMNFLYQSKFFSPSVIKKIPEFKAEIEEKTKGLPNIGDIHDIAMIVITINDKQYRFGYSDILFIYQNLRDIQFLNAEYLKNMGK